MPLRVPPAHFGGRLGQREGPVGQVCHGARVDAAELGDGALETEGEKGGEDKVFIAKLKTCRMGFLKLPFTKITVD